MPGSVHFKIVLVYYSVALLILACGYVFPANNEYFIYFPMALSVFLLIPVYVWQRNYRNKISLSKEPVAEDEGGVHFWVSALFILAMTIRIPSVLLFNEPYEKTPLIYLLVLTILLLEKTDLSVFGFKTKDFLKSLAHGLGFYTLLGGLYFTLSSILLYIFTNQMPIQAVDPSPPLLLMPFMTFCVGISEEGLFRGYIQTHLERAYTTGQAILLQAIMFGFWHFVWDLSPFNLFGMIQYIATTFLFGLLFGYFYSKIRNLTPLALAHGLWNSVPSLLVLSGSAENFYLEHPLSSQLAVDFLPFAVSLVITALLVRYFFKGNSANVEQQEKSPVGRI